MADNTEGALQSVYELLAKIRVDETKERERKRAHQAEEEVKVKLQGAQAAKIREFKAFFDQKRVRTRISDLLTLPGYDLQFSLLGRLVTTDLRRLQERPQPDLGEAE